MRLGSFTLTYLRTGHARVQAVDRALRFRGKDGRPRLHDPVGDEKAIESGGQTTMTSTMRLVSQEARDAVLATGMADGAGRSYERLGEVLATL